MKKYRIPIFMAMICMISNVAVFGQETEKEEKEKVLKVWAESYGDCQKRMEYMSDDMKKTYFADQFQRANENTFLLLQSGKTENVELHEALEVVNFRLENGDTIFYTLKNNNGKEILKLLQENYELNTAQDLSSAIKNMFKDALQEMMNAEFDNSMGYTKYDKTTEKTNYRNGTTKKNLKSEFGEFEFETPRDRNGEFEPKIVPKNTRDVSGIEDKIISLYARGLT